ncbi:hypothetical protein SAMN04487910_0832 [Aquimarina amphilecti]|uniref:Uncharacterized protein n=1 Tax=Aquimarina amphilecti TaxID=1038014 RepID=A0A1H7I291_AQUAM|nr:hypothetical protein [Aquimarina amphilecti]SEK56484.1 hypothetical protein SAMN04487910_0832 [Aquimarina amphilecti]
MKLRFFYLLLIIVCLFSSCNSNDCELVVCAPNASFRFEVVNSDGQNLLSNGMLQIADIMITDLDNQSIIDLILINENSTLEINSMSLPLGITSYSVQVSNTEFFTLELKTVRTNGECCDVINFSNLEIRNSEFVFDENTGVYTFLLE